MAKLNYNRPNNGYEKEPWAKFRQDNQKKATALNKTINKESIFIRGKFSGKDIGMVVRKNPNYCAWVLENNPTGIVAKQIIKYFNKNNLTK
jgi:hypothetical protein